MVVSRSAVFRKKEDLLSSIKTSGESEIGFLQEQFNPQRFILLEESTYEHLRTFNKKRSLASIRLVRHEKQAEDKDKHVLLCGHYDVTVASVKYPAFRHPSFTASFLEIKSERFHKDIMVKTVAVVAGVGVGMLVVVAVVVPCVLLIPSSASTDKDPFAFEDLWSGKYSYKSIYPTWDKSTSSPTDFYSMSEGAIYRREITKPYDNGAQIAPNTIPEKYSTDGYSVSPDGLYIFYWYNYNKVWRHSYTADFVVWDVQGSAELTNLGLPSSIQHMEWAPTGHRLAFVHDFTVKMIADVGDASPSIVVVSPPGQKNLNYFGIPDWMYEEEMISANNVLYWSPSASKIAFLDTNEKDVELIQYTWYGDGQYPETIEIAYPKAGTTIGNVRLWVYDVASDSLNQLDAPSEFVGGDFYFSRFTWKNDSSCLATWTNRWQTTSIAQLCLLQDGSTNFSCSHTNANREAVDGGWVGSFGPFYPLWRTDGEKSNYFTIYARANDGDDSEGYWQIAYVTEGEQTARWLTKTNYDIVGLNLYDSTKKYLYFTAAYPLPRQRHIYRVDVTETDNADPDCMTCELMKTYENRCGWVTPVFTDDGSSVVINCRGNLIPMTVYITIDSTGAWQKEILLQNNDELEAAVSMVKWPRREYNTFQSDKYPDKAYNYEIWYPEDFDPAKKYPLLIEVYAGPEFQKVTEAWARRFSQTYMVSARDMIVASVDGRGSAYEGYKFMRQGYKKLGQYEPIDQTDFAKYLISNNDFIDADHVALWGWSYGGYTTTHTLGYDAGKTFTCGIAVAPLGDWTWYDAMYAERYMGNVTENADGYEKASIIRGHDINNFKGTNYVLIHGTADDNVHFQSAAQMEKALVEADVDFDDFFYADEPHSINVGPNANQHIYHQLDIRLSYCLGRHDTPYGG